MCLLHLLKVFVSIKATFCQYFTWTSGKCGLVFYLLLALVSCRVARVVAPLFSWKQRVMIVKRL